MSGCIHILYGNHEEIKALPEMVSVRGDAVLENSIAPDRCPEDLRTHHLAAGNPLPEMVPVRGDAVLE